ncbi:hypothetical protein ANCCAN_22831 [Ancylostoma caninum]|uniref:Uncharacterized protein n=1 Tax=Ancylostoma caninum TaxID=29170 RepID=A0A368FIK6_ANCCA|nr:hypothetical protein ANCCAN_22831 [Ancylostoma caninum]
MANDDFSYMEPELNSGLSAVKTNKELSFSPAGTDGSNPTVHESFDSPVNALSGGIRRIIIEANAVKLPPLDLSPIIDNVVKESLNLHRDRFVCLDQMETAHCFRFAFFFASSGEY